MNKKELIHLEHYHHIMNNFNGNYDNFTTNELKIIENNTPSFLDLKTVDKILIKRKAIKKSSFTFFENLGIKVE